MTKTTLILTIFILGLFACKPKEQKPEEIQKSAYLVDKNQVEVMMLQQSTFTKQLVGNGKLNALRKAELRFRISGEIEQLPVGNGRHIAQGELIAALNDIDYSHRLQQA